MITNLYLSLSSYRFIYRHFTCSWFLDQRFSSESYVIFDEIMHFMFKHIKHINHFCFWISQQFYAFSQSIQVRNDLTRCQNPRHWYWISIGIDKTFCLNYFWIECKKYFDVELIESKNFLFIKFCHFLISTDEVVIFLYSEW